MLSKPRRVASTRRLAPLFQMRQTSLGHIRDRRGTEATTWTVEKMWRLAKQKQQRQVCCFACTTWWNLYAKSSGCLRIREKHACAFIINIKHTHTCTQNSPLTPAGEFPFHFHVEVWRLVGEKKQGHFLFYNSKRFHIYKYSVEKKIWIKTSLIFNSSSGTPPRAVEALR